MVVAQCDLTAHRTNAMVIQWKRKYFLSE